nr:MAG TPA: hypothetical protein [Caudoviricetes sp.]
MIAPVSRRQPLSSNNGTERNFDVASNKIC